MNGIIDESLLSDIATDPSRLLVGFPREPRTLSRMKLLRERDWSPAALAVGRRAVWMWCPGGVLAEVVFTEVGKVMGDELTTRNWSTVLKLQAALVATRMVSSQERTR